MNARFRSSLLILSWVSVVALAAVLLVLFVRSERKGGLVQAPATVRAPGGDSPLPTPAAAFVSPIVTPARGWLTPEPLPTAPPTATMPPGPTLLPTPVVTRVPITAPPIIPLPPGESEPFAIVYREGDVVKSLNSVDKQEQVLVDVQAATSRYLVDRTVGVFKWASPSPDGRKLALVVTNVKPGEDALMLHKGEHEFDIYLLDIEKGSLQLLIENGVRPTWSPDGTRIAYRNTKTQGLWIADVDTKESVEIFAVDYPQTENQADWFTWSPDGARIAVVKNWDAFAIQGGIWIVDAIPNGEKRQVVPMEMNANGLEWSPVSDEVLFLSNRGEWLTPQRPASIWAVDADSGKYRQLTQNIAVDSTLRTWSPDGKWIVFAATNLLEGETYQYDLWLLATDGTALVRLNDDPFIDLNPTWTPDGRRIVFRRIENGIWEVDLRDGSFGQVTPKEVSDFYLMKHRED